MKVIKRTIQTFVANDGKEFQTEAECLAYEQDILHKIKFYCVDFDFDLNEGRGWTNNAYLAVVPVRDADPKDIAIEFAMRIYGRGHYLTSGVQGYGAQKTFHVREISKRAYDERRGIQWTAFKNTPEQLLLSPISIEGYPAPYDYTKAWNISY
jgi:hypothetical protein